VHPLPILEYKIERDAGREAHHRKSTQQPRKEVEDADVQQDVKNLIEASEVVINSATSKQEDFLSVTLPATSECWYGKEEGLWHEQLNGAEDGIYYRFRVRARNCIGWG
jgi:hypothetical protein